MKTSYKKDLKRAYLILEGDEEQKEDYQIAMLRVNDIPGILKLEVRYVDNRSHYYYDISGKTSFQTFHEKVNLSYEDMKRLVSSLLSAIQELQCYMLDGNCLLLEPEYIFCDKEEYYFCYYPVYARREGGVDAQEGNQAYVPDAKEAFHRLTEFFVREVNYRDEEGVHFAYTLHKATMGENYSIEEIMKEMCLEQEAEAESIAEEDPIMFGYTDRMEESQIDENILEERNDFWEPVRRLLEKTRKKHLQVPTQDL